MTPGRGPLPGGARWQVALLVGVLLAGGTACSAGVATTTPARVTPVPATPLPATPVPATPVPATPVPATSVPVSGAPAVATAAPGSPAVVPATATPEPVDEGADLVLQGDGLSLVQGDTPQPLPFATASAGSVRAALSAALGELTETAAVPCPQGPRTRVDVDGFSVLLDGDRFVGWTDAGAPDRSLTTADGIGAGARLADLRSALPDAQVPAGGTTWSSAGGLSGTLSGVDPAARVATISAGQTCPG